MTAQHPKNISAKSQSQSKPSTQITTSTSMQRLQRVAKIWKHIKSEHGELIIAADMNIYLFALGKNNNQLTTYQQNQAPLIKIVQELIDEGITPIHNKETTRDNHSDKPHLLDHIYITNAAKLTSITTQSPPHTQITKYLH